MLESSLIRSPDAIRFSAAESVNNISSLLADDVPLNCIRTWLSTDGAVNYIASIKTKQREKIQASHQEDIIHLITHRKLPNSLISPVRHKMPIAISHRRGKECLMMSERERQMRPFQPRRKEQFARNAKWCIRDGPMSVLESCVIFMPRSS